MVKRSRTTKTGQKDLDGVSNTPRAPPGSDISQSDSGAAAETTGSVQQYSPDRMRRIFGFSRSDFSSWTAFVKLLCRPCDPAALGLWRFMFGLLMMVDIPQERGLSMADFRWGDREECRFPLFNFLAPLPIQWMYVVYLAMFVGACGIMLGFCFRPSCLLFVLTYWYIFLLDKTTWNNHSYLYGVIGFVFFFTDANRYWSLDGLLRPSIRNAHVPLWNYTLFRAQVFLVYFLAGLKKLDMDWVTGYSMQDLSKHWVFMPFRLILSQEQADLFVVHVGGLILDLTAGYVLFFDVTRPLATFFVCSFHVMNSQIFSIGMFSYTMLATTSLFYSMSWPRRVIHKLPVCLHRALPALAQPQPSYSCVYTKQQVKPEQDKPSAGDAPTETEPCLTKSKIIPSDNPRWRHKLSAVGVVCFLALQVFLPYSHFLTKGYNNWTNGLYGYSWDMMVHSWNTQHIRITYKDKDTGNVGYLNPEAFSNSGKRWSAHADMLKQYTACITHRLKKHNLSNVEIYFDIWRSLNDRFQQRMWDPRVDLVQAEWQPFSNTPWLMPLLTELSDWRTRLDSIEKAVYNESEYTEVVFIADFPGLTLDNYVQEDLSNTSIEILKGEVIVEAEGGQNTSLREGDKMQITAGQYHKVHTVSKSPSCYMYIFINTTEMYLVGNISIYEKRLQEAANASSESPKASVTNLTLDGSLKEKYDQVVKRRQEAAKIGNMTMLEKFNRFWRRKYLSFMRGAIMTGVALKTIALGESYTAVMNATLEIDNDLFSTMEELDV